MRSLPALESALGVSPSEAANWRADVKRWGSLTEAASAGKDRGGRISKMGERIFVAYW